MSRSSPASTAAPRRRFPAGLLVAAALLAGCSAGTDVHTAGAVRHVVPDVTGRPRPFRMAALAAPRPPARFTAAPGLVDAPAAAPLVADSAPAARTAVAPAAAEIRGMLRDYLRAFNQHDAPALAAHWSPAGESVDLDSGDVTAGREAVRDVFAALFAADESATIDIDVESIRPIRDDVAVVDGVTRVVFANGPPSGSRFSAVVVRDGGRWLLESVREAVRPEAAAVGGPLEDLAWLVGAWEDTGAGVTAGTECRWSAGRGFLVRTHAVRPDAAAEPRPRAARAGGPDLLPPGDASPRDITEIVGWDSDRRTLRSWLFTSGGRFAEATWARTTDGRGWVIRVEGRGRDEGATCTCTLAPDGADGLVMTCDSDALAGLLPPACSFARTARLGAPAAE